MLRWLALAVLISVAFLGEATEISKRSEVAPDAAARKVAHETAETHFATHGRRNDDVPDRPRRHSDPELREPRQLEPKSLIGLHESHRHEPRGHLGIHESHRHEPKGHLRLQESHRHEPKGHLGLHVSHRHEPKGNLGLQESHHHEPKGNLGLQESHRQGAKGHLGLHESHRRDPNGHPGLHESHSHEPKGHLGLHESQHHEPKGHLKLHESREHEEPRHLEPEGHRVLYDEHEPRGPSVAVCLCDPHHKAHHTPKGVGIIEPTWFLDNRYVKTGNRDYANAEGGQVIIVPEPIKNHEHKGFGSFDELLEFARLKKLAEKSAHLLHPEKGHGLGYMRSHEDRMEQMRGRMVQEHDRHTEYLRGHYEH